MRLPTTLSVIECERQIQKICNSIGTIDLDVPREIKYAAAGGGAALAQLLITWAQLNPSGRLYILAPDTSEDGLRELVRIPHICLLALLNRKVSERKTQFDLTEKLKSAAVEFLSRSYDDVLVETKFQKGPFCSILCDDHDGYSTPMQLYSKDAFGEIHPRGLDQIELLIYYIFDDLSVGRRLKNNAISDQLLNALSGCLFELFCNTHEHARDGIDKVALSMSLRGAYFRRTSLPHDDWRRIFDGYQPLLMFIDRQPSSRPVAMFEMSIFDSGAGLAEFWLERPLNEVSLEQEIVATETCFLDGESTKRHGRYGKGLPAVVKHLAKQGAFLRLRTGRVSAFADLGIAGSTADNRPFALSYWKLSNNSQMPRVIGTLFTLLIPENVPAE